MIGRLGALLGTVVLLGGCSWAGGDGRDRNPMNHPGYVLESPGAAPMVHRLRGDTPATSFALVNGVDVVRVRVADLGRDRYEVSTPYGSRVVPTVVVNDDEIVAGVRDSHQAGPAVLDVVLDASVRWRVRLAGGATDESVDLTGGPGGDVDFSAGTARASVTLPAGRGTQRVLLAGGASELYVRLAGDAPVRVRAGSGAGRMSVDGDTRSGIAAGTVWEAPAWPSATDRYDIDAAAGVGNIAVGRP